MKETEVVDTRVEKGAARRGGRQWGDPVFRAVTLAAAVSMVALLALFFVELVYHSGPAIAHFGLGFLFSAAWNPVANQFGALTSIYGTLLTTFIAVAIAVPLSFFIALFLVEIAPPALAVPIGYAIELLAAIPSIIYGMWGLFVFAPYMAEHVQPVINRCFGFLPFFRGPSMGIGMLTAGIILALMILPFMTAITRDVFLMIPSTLREAAFGIGATVWEVRTRVTMAYGPGALVGGLFLGLGRALGETMAVTFVIGNSHDISLSLFQPGNTITSTLANEFAEASDPLYLSALTELGLILLVLTFLIQGAARLWVGRYRKRTEGTA
jgi:phosphate transport system permease protein